MIMRPTALVFGGDPGGWFEMFGGVFPYFQSDTDPLLQSGNPAETSLGFPPVFFLNTMATWAREVPNM